MQAQHQLVTVFEQLKTKQGESIQIQIHHTEKTGKAQGSTPPWSLRVTLKALGHLSG